jgi:hypothetical protein
VKRESGEIQNSERDLSGDGNGRILTKYWLEKRCKMLGRYVEFGCVFLPKGRYFCFRCALFNQNCANWTKKLSIENRFVTGVN